MNPRKLERIIGVRERVKKIRKGELREAAEAMNEAAERHAEAEGVQRDSIEELTSGRPMTGEELAHRAQMVELARRDAQRAQKALEEKTTEHGRRSDAMVEASRDVKVLEALKGREDQRRSKEQRRREQEHSDEIAGQKGSRS